MLELNEQISTGLAAAQAVALPNPADYSKVVLVGVGGSSMAAAAIEMLELPITTQIAGGYHLPSRLGKTDLVIVTSWSGETAETIRLLKEVADENYPAIVITANPESDLARLAKQADLPLVLLPNFTPIPRLAFPAMLAAQLTILGQSAILNKADEFTLALTDKADQQASHLAQAIGDKIPLLYSSFAWRRLGAFWKTFINETTERHCFSNYLPRAVHNEIVPLSASGKRGSSLDTAGLPFCCILLSDQDEEIETTQLKRLASWFEKKQQTVLSLEISGQSRLEKILFQYLLAEKTSALLAGGEHKTPAAIKEFKEF